MEQNAPTGLLLFAILALIFVIAVTDAATPLAVVVSMLYVAPVLLAARLTHPFGIIFTAAGCALLTILVCVYLMQQSAPAARLDGAVDALITLGALTTTAIIALQGRAREQRLREQASLLDLTHDSIFVRGMDDVIRYWNRGSKELYGWPTEAAAGKVSHELLGTRFPAPLEDINAELLSSGRWEGELVHTRRDGSQVTVLSRWSLHRDADGRPELVMESNHDMTSRQRAEYLVNRVFDAVPLYMNIYGPDYRLQRANPANCKVLGVEEAAVIGRHAREILGDEIFEAVSEPALRRALAGEAFDVTGWWPGWAQRFGRVSYTPLRPGGDKVEGVLVVGQDLTDLAHAAEALREAQAGLAHANRVTTMGQLTASIAHEVNQPIHAAGMSARAARRWLAAEPPAMGEAHEALGRVIHNVTRAGEVIARIRDLVMKAPPQHEWFALDAVVREVVALIRSEAQKHDTLVELRLAAGLPPVRGDRVQLQQVMLNLIMNAIEAMSGADVQAKQVTIGARLDEEGGVLVAVEDTGPGLKPDTADRLFEAFFTTKSEGMGMGLAICQSIVEGHGGRLWASPNAPRGAVFQFTLPAPGEEVSEAAAEVA